MQGEDFYSVDEAAKVLKLPPGRIRKMLRAGEMEGVPPGEGILPSSG
jgi:excisionase family DNA binding protein